MGLFSAALLSLETTPFASLKPTSFQQYCCENGLSAPKTAQHISVDSIERLNPELRGANCMVFRLGKCSEAGGTRFSLVRGPAPWPDDAFLIDSLIFKNCAI